MLHFWRLLEPRLPRPAAAAVAMDRNRPRSLSGTSEDNRAAAAEAVLDVWKQRISDQGAPNALVYLEPPAVIAAGVHTQIWCCSLAFRFGVLLVFPCSLKRQLVRSRKPGNVWISSVCLK